MSSASSAAQKNINSAKVKTSSFRAKQSFGPGRQVPERLSIFFLNIPSDSMPTIARISGVTLPKEKRIEVGLTFIYGIGRSLSHKILRDTNINPDTHVEELSENDLNVLRERISKMLSEGDLRRKVQMDIKRLQEIGSYRGYRHRRGLPVRGQKTRSNARTRKGKKKTVANKKITTK